MRPVRPDREQLQPLIQQVGDDETLDRLDVDPLPDEPLDLDPVPPDIDDRVQRTAGLTDACCEDVLDIGYRTASSSPIPAARQRSNWPDGSVSAAASPSEPRPCCAP